VAESDHGSELQERIFRFPPVAQRHVVSRHFPSPAVRGEIQNPHCLRWSRVFDRLSKCGAFKSRLPEPTLREAVREQGLRKNTDPLGFYRRRRPSRLTTRATRSDRSADMVRRRKRECRRWAVTRMSSIVLSTPRVRTLMLAVKHLDPIMGIDIHIVQPPGPVPPPIPSVHRNRARCCGLHPQDRRDCLHQRSSAGNRRHGRTGHSLAHPHGRRVREAADQRERAFPGQRDVAADDNPLVYGMLPVLTCQDIGMPALPRLKKHSTPKSLMLRSEYRSPFPPDRRSWWKARPRFSQRSSRWRRRWRLARP